MPASPRGKPRDASPLAVHKLLVRTVYYRGCAKLLACPIQPSTLPQSARSGCQLPQRWSQGGRAADRSTYSSTPGAMCKMFRPVAVYRLGTATGLFIIQGVQVRRQRGVQSITACPPSPGPGDRRSAPHRPSCGCAVPHRKVWQAYCRLHLEADMHRFLAIFALSIR